MTTNEVLADVTVTTTLNKIVAVLPKRRDLASALGMSVIRLNRFTADEFEAAWGAALLAEIEHRGGEIEIIDQHKRSVGASVVASELVETPQRLRLIGCSGWRGYGSHPARKASLRYLAGIDDAGLFAVRVPGTVGTVADAVVWLTPRGCIDALCDGKNVYRQGDFYAIATTARHDEPSRTLSNRWRNGELEPGHCWDADARILSHPEHEDIRLPHPVRFVEQSAYGMGRGTGRGAGD